LRRNVVIEVVAGAVILAVVAVLGVTPPGLGE
jgi:putative copper export protein